MYHIEDVKNYINCPKLFQYVYFNNTHNNYFHCRSNETISNIGINKLNIKDYYLGKQGDHKNIAITKINEYEWVIKGRFEYKELRVKIPFIHRIKGSLIDVVFFSTALYPTPSDLNYYQACIWVLKKNLLNINEISILHPNAKYIRNQNDNNDILNYTKYFYNSNKTKSVSITKIINNHNVNFNKILREMNDINIDSNILPRSNKTKQSCTLCPIKNTCFNNEDEQCDSILTLHSYKSKYSLYLSGITSLKQLDINTTKFNQTQIAQISAAKNKGEYYQPILLKKWLNKINTRPLVFFDFEWDTFYLPPYNMMKAYDVITFQYSLHILDENNKLIHKEFIGKNDCRRQFIESLLNDVDINSKFICFNALGGEILRLKEFIKYFPEYSDKIQKIISNTYDLSDIFNLGYYYNIKMGGKYNLKTISQIFTDTTYNKQEEIHDGLQAVMLWRDQENLDSNDEFKINKLLEYCSQDSLNLYKIYSYLCNLIK